MSVYDGRENNNRGFVHNLASLIFFPTASILSILYIQAGVSIIENNAFFLFGEWAPHNQIRGLSSDACLTPYYDDHKFSYIIPFPIQ